MLACALVAQSCLTLCDPMDCSPPGFSVHLCPGILQARILEWVAIRFSWETPQSRDWTLVSCIAGRFFTVWATGNPHLLKDWLQLSPLSWIASVTLCLSWSLPFSIQIGCSSLHLITKEQTRNTLHRAHVLPWLLTYFSAPCFEQNSSKGLSASPPASLSTFPFCCFHPSHTGRLLSFKLTTFTPGPLPLLFFLSGVVFPHASAWFAPSFHWGLSLNVICSKRLSLQLSLFSGLRYICLFRGCDGSSLLLRLSLVAGSRGSPSLPCLAFSLPWLLSCFGAQTLGARASVVAARGLSSCGSQTLEPWFSSWGHRLSSSAVCGIFLGQGWSWCSLHCKVDSLHCKVDSLHCKVDL